MPLVPGNPLPQTTLTDLQKVYAQFMPDTATNSRTALAVACSVTADRRDLPLHGMPEHLRFMRWRLAFPIGTDVKTGDRVVITRTGATYIVVEVKNPAASSVSYGIAQHTLAILSNASVTFSRPGVSGASVGPVAVYIARVSEQLQAMGIQYGWEALYGSDIVFPGTPTGGIIISAGDQMAWPRSPNPIPGGGVVTLDKPRYAYVESAIAAAYFNEGR